MDKVLEDINRKYISLPEDEVRRNNEILDSILSSFVTSMKAKDPLFNALFRRVFYGGSYYDGLRVGKPEEFDLDLLLHIPVLAQPELTTSNIPGFVHVQLKNYDAWSKQPEAKNFRNFEKLFDEKKYLMTDKTLNWMEGLVQTTLNSFSKDQFQIKFKKSGPALTLQISHTGSFKIDVDLVPCFVFGANKWPINGFKSNPFPSALPEFFIVPKKPKAPANQPILRYWRLSFQEQERKLIDNKQNLKPTIKLLKKLRDNLQHKVIASYFIKTVALHIIFQKEESFWRKPLSEVFMIVLREYNQFIINKEIPYYWYRRNNLIGNINAATLENISGKLTAAIRDIERNPETPATVAKYLLTRNELISFGNGDKVTAGIGQPNNELAQPKDEQSSCLIS